MAGVTSQQNSENRPSQQTIQHNPSDALNDQEWDLRFSKFSFLTNSKNNVDQKVNKEEISKLIPYPLTRADYPVEGRLGVWLQYTTNAISVITAHGDDYELQGVDLAHYLSVAGGLPTYPHNDPDHAFWEDFRHVINAQTARRQNKLPPASDLTLPDIWSDMDVHQVAEAVHDEYPGYWQAVQLDQLWKENVQIDYSILPFRSQYDFVGGPIRMAELNTWSTGQVSPITFCLKWFAGRPRPEEVAYSISRDNAEVAPPDLVATIRDWNMTTPADATAYPEGSPRHPAWPAMHSAGSTASLWMAVVFVLTPAQYCQVLRTDYAVAYARTVAGVHYPTDNTAGLNVGQEILARRLPGHLATRYGADRAAVERKIKDLRFDWNDFDPVTCSTAPATTGDDEADQAYWFKPARAHRTNTNP